MPPSSQPVAITPLGPSSAATVTWLLRGQLHVTVVVKATFALVPEGRMSLTTPEPIAPDEQPDPSGRGLRSAGDLAPYRQQGDVLVTGHAELPPGFSSPEVMVRLTVVQGGQVHIDKQTQLDGAARVGAGRSHVRIDGMGPLSRSSPLRSRLLGGIDARRLAGLWLDVPEGLDGSYFQAAPADQRLGALRGDEWIVLGGMIAQRPKLRTQLPEARGAARLYRQQRGALRTGEPIDLRADTVLVDVDRRCCSMVWRGHVPVHEAELASLRVLAGVETPALPLVWSDPFATGGAPAASPAPPAASAVRTAPGAPSAQRPGAGGNPLEGTSPISPEEAARVLAAAATPFDARRAPAGGARSTPAPPVDAEAPRRLDRRAPRSGEGNPLEGPARLAGANPLEETALVAGSNPLEGTNPIRPEEAARLLAAPATPFEARRAPAEPARAAAPAVSSPAAASRTGAAAPAPSEGSGNPLEGTSLLRPEEAARLLASPATPFDVRRAPEATPFDVRRAPEATPFDVRRAPDPPRIAPLPHAAPSSAALGPPPALREISPPACPTAHFAQPPLASPGAATQPIVASPGGATQPVVPPSGEGDRGALPEGLGAQFLAAMADMELLAGDVGPHRRGSSTA